MSKASRRERPVRPTGAARRKAQAAQRRRQRRLLTASVAAVVALVGVVVGLHLSGRSPGSQPARPTSAGSLPVGTKAPNATFTTLAGTTADVASLRGKPTLLWFVSTWCSSCQAGTESVAQNLAKLRADGVRVDELELYKDLGQSGPSIVTFAKSFAGAQFANPDWTFGVSSAGLTRTYDPQSYLDIYYLLNAKGRVAYANSSPASTMPQLLQAALRLA